ncbi:MAG: Radical superfamily [Planctomycetota bacterium]|jgi:hypothetical protein
MNGRPSFPVIGVHQIEMTSECNLRCRYCVHPTMARPKQHMDDLTYRQTLAQVSLLIKRQDRRQRELNLAGIGESTMHPDFVRNVFLAREAVGLSVELIIATNGLLMTPAMAMAIKAARPRVWVSLHRPEKAGPAVEALKAAGILAGVSADPSVSSVNWAGQVKWHVSTPIKGSACPWVPKGMVFVMADGRVTRCCFDGVGSDTLGTVWDDLCAMHTSAFSLCDSCHHNVTVAA